MRFQQLAVRAVREKAEVEAAERKREEQKRLEHELSIRRENNAKLIAELERQAGAWFRAKFLQRYLRALRRAAGEGRLQGMLGDEKVDFLLWAEQYVSQLDPLPKTPRNPDQQCGRSPYWRSDEEALKKQLFRLFSCENKVPWKLTSVGSSDSEGDTSDEADYELADAP